VDILISFKMGEAIQWIMDRRK